MRVLHNRGVFGYSHGPQLPTTMSRLFCCLCEFKNEHTWQFVRNKIVERANPEIDKRAHLELRMCGEDAMANLYERTGDLHEALMGASEDWQFDPTLSLINRRAELRRQNGGELPKATDSV